MSSVISIKNLTKRNPGYVKNPKGRELLLKDFSAEFTKGKVSLIIGENGCGKSTLINCISGLSKFENGIIKVTGNDINYELNKKYNENAVIRNRHNLGIIFQQKALWEQYTVLDNVVQPLFNVDPELRKEEAKEKAIKLLKKIGIDENLLYCYPTKISGGEQRKVAVARTLITEPEILLIDEIEANLDLGALEDILRFLRDDYLDIGNANNSNQKTIIIISHRIDLIELKFAPELFLLSEGELVIHSKNFSELQENKKGNKRISSFIKDVIDPARSQWYFGTACLQTAKQISKLITADSKISIGENGMLEKVGEHLFDLITKLESDEGHLLMIATLEKDKSGQEITRIRSIDMTKDIKSLKLDGKDINQLCKKIRENVAEEETGKFNISFKANYKDTIKTDVCEFDDRNSGIEFAMTSSNIIFYQASNYHEKIYGCKKIQPKKETNQSIELCKATNTVYLITIKDDEEVLGVISIDTTSEELWSNTVMEQFVLVANMAAIAIKQSKIEKINVNK